jgi:hypothetical protein
MLLGLLLIAIGALFLWLSFWLLLHASDEKVQRSFDSWINERLAKNKTEAEGYRVYNLAMTGVLLMFFGVGFVVAGLVSILT